VRAGRVGDQFAGEFRGVEHGLVGTLANRRHEVRGVAD